MRARYPHDDPPARRRNEPYRGPPVTLSFAIPRLPTIPDLLLHRAVPSQRVVDADRWPDETAVRDRCRKAVCTKCGMIGADVRPNWQDRSERESLTASHSR